MSLDTSAKVCSPKTKTDELPGDLKVFLGLQKRKRCALCLQDFFVDDFPGTITYKSVLELRRKWGVEVTKNGLLPSPSHLYDPKKLCVYCSQFFDTSSGSSDSKGQSQSRSSTGAAQSPARSPKQRQDGGVSRLLS